MIMIESLHPVLLLLLAAASTVWLRGWSRTAVTLLLATCALILVWQMPGGRSFEFVLGESRLALLALDYLARLFAILFTLLAVLTVLYGGGRSTYAETGYGLTHAAAAVAVVLAGDWLTLIFAWLMLILTASLLVSVQPGRHAYAAARRLLFLHGMASVFLLIGVVGQVYTSGSVDLAILVSDGDIEAWPAFLILLAVLTAIAAPPLSAWFADCCQELSALSLVWFSAFTGKAGVYLLLRLFPGFEWLLAVGLLMLIYGAVFALLSRNITRLLGYGFISSTGIIVMAVGLGNDTGLSGAAGFAFVHGLIFALLFMSAGVVIERGRSSQLSSLGGLFQRMPLTTAYTLIAALSLLAMPLTAGYISQLLIIEAAFEPGSVWPGIVFLLAVVTAVVHAGFYYPWRVFFGPAKPPAEDIAEAVFNQRVAMFVLAALCIVVGMAPCRLYQSLPYAVSCEPYTPGFVLTQLQLLFAAVLAAAWLLSYWRVPSADPVDFDQVYRHWWPRQWPAIRTRLLRGLKVCADICRRLWQRLVCLWHYCLLRGRQLLRNYRSRK